MTKTFVLSNGIRLAVAPMGSRASVSLGIWFQTGSAYESKENNGISHLLEHMVFQGTRKRSAKEIAEEEVRLGGNLNAYTGRECTNYYLTTLPEMLSDSMKLLEDMLFHSVFLEKNLQKEKKVILEEIDMYEDSPEDMVHEKLEQKIWRNHPLGFQISGTKTLVRRFTREALHSYWKKEYCGSNMVISIAGNCQVERCLELVEHIFGKVPKGNCGAKGTSAAYYQSYFEKAQEMEQVHLNLAFLSCDSYSPRRFVSALVQGVLGGSDNSRLFQTLREEQGLCYAVSSYDSLTGLGGLFHIDATMHPSKASKGVESILKIIGEIQKKGFTSQERKSAIDQIRTEMILTGESTRSCMQRHGRSLLKWNRIVTQKETLRNLEEVTLGDMQEFATQCLQIQQMSVGLVGNLPKTPVI